MERRLPSIPSWAIGVPWMVWFNALRPEVFATRAEREAAQGPARGARREKG